MRKIIIAISCIITGSCVIGNAAECSCTDVGIRGIDETRKIFNGFWKKMRLAFRDKNLDEYKKMFAERCEDACAGICRLREQCGDEKSIKAMSAIEEYMRKCKDIIRGAKSFADFFVGGFKKYTCMHPRNSNVKLAIIRRETCIDRGCGEIHELKKGYLNVLTEENNVNKVKELLESADSIMRECCCDMRIFNDCLNNANRRNANFRNANSAETLNMIKKYLYTIVSHDVLLTRSIMEHLFIMEKEMEKEAEALEEARLLLKIREKEKAAKEKQILDEQRSYIKVNGFMFSLVFQDGNVGHDEKHWHGKEYYPIKVVYGDYDTHKVVSNMSNDVTIGELLKSYYEHGENKEGKVVNEIVKVQQVDAGLFCFLSISLYIVKIIILSKL